MVAIVKWQILLGLLMRLRDFLRDFYPPGQKENDMM